MKTVQVDRARATELYVCLSTHNMLGLLSDHSINLIVVAVVVISAPGGRKQDIKAYMALVQR